MNFKKVEVSVFDADGHVTGEKKLRWELNTTEGRFTAPEWMTKEQLEKAMTDGSFAETTFKTADGRPVYTILTRKVVDEFSTKDNKIVVSKATRALQLETAEITYLE
jgi:hypothetical protein